MASGDENGSRSRRMLSAAVAPLVLVPAIGVTWVMLLVGSTGFGPGLIGIMNGTTLFAVLKSVGFSTNAKCPRSPCGFGMHIAFSLMRS